MAGVTEGHPPGTAADTATAVASGAAQLGCPLLPSQVGALMAYTEALKRWSNVHNLSAVRSSEDTLFKHLLDSLAVVRPLEVFLGARDARLLDVGTGAGLPAIVIAIARPQWHLVAVDAVGKKVAFVRQEAGELGLTNLKVVHARVETMKRVEPFDVILSRAFSTLHDFVTKTRRLLADRGAWVALKGRRPVDEIDQVGDGVEVFHVEPIEVPGLRADRCLVWMRKVSMA